MTTQCKQDFEFVFTLDGDIDTYDRLENVLFEAGCSDATLSLRSGAIYLAFCREAVSYEEAVASAIADVAKAGGHRLQDPKFDEQIANRIYQTVNPR